MSIQLSGGRYTFHHTSSPTLQNFVQFSNIYQPQNFSNPIKPASPIQMNPNPIKILALFLLIFSYPLPAYSQSPIKLGGKEYPILNEVQITISRNQLNLPVSHYTDKTPNQRYEFIKFLPILTQEEEIAPPPAGRQLYRLVEIYDSQTQKTLQVAIPLKIE
ncbi:hypothetical protein NG798_00685 [Ancylothrix sp. C2]|uniref:hypothetical protein n=1 Tax=Ancylothrix sp. D3o TaxID=2953691 RepID=UPI0021BA669E|nr:hypothetical protein [Ancylothrix sp. D3o]MCT7948308.1 hypothetical protein [Ancylothrix sp. D3o]